MLWYYNKHPWAWQTDFSVFENCQNIAPLGHWLLKSCLILRFTLSFQNRIWRNGASFYVPTQRKISVLHFVLRAATKTQTASKTFLTFQSPRLPPMCWPPLLQPWDKSRAFITSGAQPHQRFSQNPLDMSIFILSDPLREHLQFSKIGFPSREATLSRQTTLTCMLMSLGWLPPSSCGLFLLHFHVYFHVFLLYFHCIVFAWISFKSRWVLCLLCYQEDHRITQNHRMFGVGRHLCGSSSPTLLPKQGHLQ